MSTTSASLENDYYGRYTLPRGVKVDPKDRGLAEHITWIIAPSGHVVQDHPRGKSGFVLYLDRLIMMATSSQSVRHINGDLLDCRRENLCLERIL